jgi:DNA-binding NtrC family response regulator
MNRRALVVDDDALMVKTLAEILAMKGWEVTTAYDGATAVRVAESGTPFDVVLMDVRMPGMDGVSAFKAMKRLRPGVRVVLMTAFAADELIAEAEREGVMRVLDKPIHIGALLGMLDHSLGGRKPVLLIDEDIAFLRTLSEVLRLRGFDTVIAGNLDQATRMLEERRPAAVLLHMHLGAISPRDAAIAVHRLSPEVALILYSGQPGAQEEIDGGVPAEWVSAYLQKPFAVEQVEGLLNAVVKD